MYTPNRRLGVTSDIDYSSSKKSCYAYYQSERDAGPAVGYGSILYNGRWEQGRNTGAVPSTQTTERGISQGDMLIAAKQKRMTSATALGERKTNNERKINDY